jgi:hypothetical protein
VGTLDPIFHTRAIMTMVKGKKHVFATFDNFTALGICIYAWTGFPVHLSAKADPQLLSLST